MTVRRGVGVHRSAGRLGTVGCVNLLRAADDLGSACGTDPSWLCESVFDLTGGNELVASTVEVVVVIAVIAFFAWLLAGGRRKEGEKYAGLRSLR